MVAMCLYPMVQNAQALWDFRLTDFPLDGKRTAMAGTLATILGNRIAMNGTMTDLIRAEKDFHDKVTSHTDLDALQLQTIKAALNQLLIAEFADTRTEIARVKAIPFYWRHGIQKIESEVDREFEYFRRANQDVVARVTQGVLFSGGRGMFETVFLKYALQLRRIHNNLLQIRYRLDNRAVVNRAYKE